MLAGALGGALIGPAPAASVARLDTMGTQVQGLSDNVADLQARIGKLDQKLTDIQNTLQNVDSKMAAPPPSAIPTASFNGSGPASSAPTPGMTPTASAAPPASADVLYSNGLRDINGKHYDLATQEFQDYLKYYGETDLASNAQFYLGEIAYSQKKYEDAVAEYERVLNNYPKSFKLAPARLKKGMALIELGQKPGGIRELREVVKRYPGTEEDRRARAKLKELGVAITATR